MPLRTALSYPEIVTSGFKNSNKAQTQWLQNAEFRRWLVNVFASSSKTKDDNSQNANKLAGK